MQEIKVQHKYTLPAKGTWKETVHVFDTRTQNAIMAAWWAERPLLVRGDPGTGKSQLGRAAATALGWQFLSEVVNAHTDIQDLWCQFDAVSRLGQAQLLGAIGDKYTTAEIEQKLKAESYLSPGVLWWAYDWTSAQVYFNNSQCQQYHPDPQASENKPKGVVLLIDEIDKADADLPNSLLETLDNARFRIPWVKQDIGYQQDDPQAVRPLVIITTNEDRQLPAAFVRRCLVLNLELPELKQDLVDYLVERGEQHFINNKGQSFFDKKLLIEIAEQLYTDRLKAEELGVKPPGQAEYLDILRVLSKLEGGFQQQWDKLQQIKDFALKKYPGMKQKQEEQ